MLKFLLGSAALAALAAVPSLAQPAPGAPGASQPRMMEMARKTQTRAEVAAKVQQQFARIDANRDGFVDRSESTAARQQMGRRVGRMGGERLAERLAGRGQQAAPMRNRAAAFDRLDTNNDGMISRQEFAAAPARAERRIVKRGDGARGAMRMNRGGRMGGLQGRMFDMADLNRDNRVSLQEATEAAIRRFDMADINRDGQLSPDERRQNRERMGAQRRPG